MTKIKNLKHHQALSLLIGHIPTIPGILICPIVRVTRAAAGGEFGISVIVIWNLFEIWCLAFGIYSIFTYNIEISKNISPEKMTEHHLYIWCCFSVF